MSHVRIGNPSLVIAEIARAFECSPDDLTGYSRLQSISAVRHLAYLAVRTCCNLSFPKVARAFNRRDHTTIMHGVKVAHDLLGVPHNAELYAAALKRLGFEYQAPTP